MQAITGKELEYIVDSISNEDLLIKQCAATAAATQNPTIQQACQQYIRSLDHHIDLLFMQDEDLLYTILADLKRTVREYTTATTESSCPTVRQLFTQLTNDTLRMQGELYNLMKQLNMYSTSSKALRQDVDKSIQDARNLQQKNLKKARGTSAGGCCMKQLTDLKLKVLDLLNEDARRSPALLATLIGVEEEAVKEAIAELEQDHVIVKYAAVVNWSKIEDETVTALIEVQITPERGRGFEGIAERIYLYPQVKSVYLMSGAYDLLVEVEGRNLREVANFVSEKLSPIDSVLSTKTNFILKKYKQDGIIFEDREEDNRLMISP
ncbi:hypothetical protein BGX30_014478 [Mortierella sp. GBA39]|nr:hypothetical protein BGX30_014478 [Mortierella sp. GBA39]